MPNPAPAPAADAPPPAPAPSSPSASSRGPTWPGWRCYAVLLSVAALVWAPTLALDFSFDDYQVIVDSARLHRLNAALEVFRQPAMWSAGLEVGPVGTYRPLALARFVLDYQLFGLKPFGYHLSSLLWHLVAQGAALAFFLRWLPARAALALALLAAVHPASVEAVAWINGCSELFAAAFGFLALSVASGPLARPQRLLLLGTLLLLALLGKETGVIFLPLALFCAALWAWQAQGSLIAVRAALLRSGAAALAATLAYAALRLNALGFHAVPRNASPLETLGAVPATIYLGTQAFLLPLHRGLALLAVREAPASERALWLAAALAAAGLLALALRRRSFLPALGLAWWLGGLLPVTAAVITYGRWPGLNRWLYVGAPGLLLAVHGALAPRLRPRVATILVGATAALWIGLCERAIPAWRNDGTLFATMIEEHPDEWMGYGRLGAFLYERGLHAPAVEVLEQGLRRASPHERPFTAALLAGSLAQTGRCDAAAARYPRPSTAVVPEPTFARLLFRCYQQAGQPDRARAVADRCAAQPACRAALADLR